MRGVDWLWMQQGHGFTVEGKGRFWEKDEEVGTRVIESKVRENADRKAGERIQAFAAALRKFPLCEDDVRKQYAARFEVLEE